MTKPTPRQKREDAMLKSCAKFLEDNGWKALVISASGIRSTEMTCNFELVIKFTGGKK